MMLLDAVCRFLGFLSGTGGDLSAWFRPLFLPEMRCHLPFVKVGGVVILDGLKKIVKLEVELGRDESRRKVQHEGN